MQDHVDPDLNQAVQDYVNPGLNRAPLMANNMPCPRNGMLMQNAAREVTKVIFDGEWNWQWQWRRRRATHSGTAADTAPRPGCYESRNELIDAFIDPGPTAKYTFKLRETPDSDFKFSGAPPDHTPVEGDLPFVRQRFSVSNAISAHEVPEVDMIFKKCTYEGIYLAYNYDVQHIAGIYIYRYI
jgi:hypothetical protein